MSRQAKLILLCEDQQHSAFMRRFFEKAGWRKKDIRIEMSPPGKGSAEKFIRDRFPKELLEYRKRKNHVKCRLVIMTDGDGYGVQGRIDMLNDACREHSVMPRDKDE